MATQKHTGFDGEIRYYAPRNCWFGFMGGKVVVTKSSEAAVRTFLAGYVPGSVVKTPKIPVSVKAPKVSQTPTNGVRAKVIAMTEAAHAKARAMFPMYSHKGTPSISFYNRGRTAGKAWRGIQKVAFNEVLAAENLDTFEDTVLHEVAHLVVNEVYPGAKPHGPEFKRVLIAMGGTGKRCHSYDTSSVSVKRGGVRYVYKCACQEHKLSAVRHRKAATFGTKYFCKRCRTTVAYTGQTA